MDMKGNKGSTIKWCPSIKPNTRAAHVARKPASYCPAVLSDNASISCLPAGFLACL